MQPAPIEIIRRQQEAFFLAFLLQSLAHGRGQDGADPFVRFWPKRTGGSREIDAVVEGLLAMCAPVAVNVARAWLNRELSG